MRIMVSMTVLNKPPPRTRELGNLYSNKTERLTTPRGHGWAGARLRTGWICGGSIGLLDVTENIFFPTYSPSRAIDVSGESGADSHR